MTDPDDPVASRLNSLPNYVASRTFKDVSWAGSTRIEGDLAAEVAELKRRPDANCRSNGTGVLARSLIQHDLIDDYRLLTYPVVLGEGERLSANGTKPAALRLLESKTTSAGVTVDVYEPAGEPTYGSFELEQ